MAYSATVQEAITIGGKTYSKSNTFSDNAELHITKDVATAEANYEIDCTMAVAEISAVFINSTQDVILETNDGTTPDETINLVANVPYVWHENSYHVNLLATDITALFVTNTSGATATIDVHVLYNAVPA